MKINSTLFRSFLFQWARRSLSVRSDSLISEPLDFLKAFGVLLSSFLTPSLPLDTFSASVPILPDGEFFLLGNGPRAKTFLRLLAKMLVPFRPSFP